MAVGNYPHYFRMTNQELRDLYGCLKDRAENADTLPSFAAVLRAKREGRIVAEQGIEDGWLTITGTDAGTWRWAWRSE